MASAKPKTLKNHIEANLPNIAHRLIESNKQKLTKLGKAGFCFRGNLEKTTHYLRWKSNCSTVLEAIEFIGEETERERIYRLYRQIFPKDWRASSASFTKNGDNEYHTERESEFFSRVSENYFPLGIWLDWSDFRFDHIPIESVNLDLCCSDYEWQEMRPCLRFAVAAFLWRGSGIYDMEWNEILSSFNVELEDLPPISREHPPYHELERERNNPKINRFLHLIEFIHHDTGNPFIDTTCCQPVDLFEWTKENLEKLKTDYDAVKAFFESMDSIDEDIERNALRAFKELISLWNTGRLPGKRRKEAAGKKEETAGLLINILADSTDSALTF
jgi:hypothetical protein